MRIGGKITPPQPGVRLDQPTLRVRGAVYGVTPKTELDFEVQIDDPTSGEGIVALRGEDYPLLAMVSGLTELDDRLRALDPRDERAASLRDERERALDALEGAVAAEPLIAQALEETPPATQPTVAVFKVGSGPQRVEHRVAFSARPNLETADQLRTQIRWAAPSKGTDDVEYGWGRRPGEPCVKKSGLPRWCLQQRNVVEPELPDAEIEFNLLWHLATSKDRLRLLGMGLTTNQVNSAEAYFDSADFFDFIRRAKGLRFGPAIDANRQPLPSSQQIQQLAYSTFEGSFHPATIANADLVKTLFLGMKPCWPEPTAEGPTVRMHFTAFEHRTPAEPDGYELPDVEVVLNADKTDLVRIRYRFEETLAWTVVDAGEDDQRWTDWGHAKRLAFLAAFVHGQYEGHVAAHLLLESLQVALARVDVSDEVRDFLEPFVRGVAEVNNYGNDLIVGEFGILCRGVGLTLDGSVTYAAHSLGKHDWKGFQPRGRTAGRDEHDNSTRARAYWNFVLDFVRQRMPPFVTHSASYERLVTEMVAHSVPCTAPKREAFEPSVHGEIPDPPDHPGRVFVDGRARSLSMIRFADPDASQQVVQFLAFFIYQATYVHTNANDQQRDVGGDLRVCPMGIRGRGVPASEDDFWTHFAPRPSEAAMQLFLIDVLSQVDTPRLVLDGLSEWFAEDDLHRFAEGMQSQLETRGVFLDRIRRAPSI